MPTVEPAGTALFLKRWLRRPFATGAVVPSGRLLAEAMARTTRSVIDGRPGHVVELGAGTGEVTKALLAAGIAPERLVLVERDPEFATFLRRHFRGPRIVEGDAARLPRAQAAHPAQPARAATSLRRTRQAHLAQCAAGRGLDLHEAGGVTSFAFDDALRRTITDHLGRFELRRRAETGGLKRAAVAVVVVEGDAPGEAAFLLTKRTPRLRAHGGQWALPGGRVDAGETIEQTALRELHEELGVLASTDDILGTLDDYPTRSGYLIAPVIVWSPGITVTPNPAEVAAAYRIACRELFRDGSPEIVAIEESDRPIIRLPLPVANVNAPTAAVLYQFREVALAGRDTRVDHFEQPVFAWR